MRSFIKIIQVCVFLLVGELVFRLDKATNIFGTNVVLIETSIRESSELHLLNNNKIPLGDSSLRILILGDSYIYGGGVDSNKKFSSVLKHLFDNSRSYANKKVFVLDVSRAANNTLDNYNTYFQFAEKFKPQLVILGYNINDVEGELDVKQPEKSSGSLKLPKRSGQKLTVVDKLYKALFNSLMLKKSLSSINSYLKSYGIVVPNTQFDIELKYYTENRSPWTKSKQLLDSMFSDCSKNNSACIVFLMPEINLLEHPQLFYKTDTIIENYIKDRKGITFINGRNIFSGHKSQDFILSKYDGHPNEKAHAIMAKFIFDYLNNAHIVK